MGDTRVTGPELLRVLAAESRAQTPLDDEDYPETIALCEVFEAAADVLDHTDRRQRGTEVNALLWKVLTLGRLLVAAVVEEPEETGDGHG